MQNNRCTTGSFTGRPSHGTGVGGAQDEERQTGGSVSFFGHLLDPGLGDARDFSGTENHEAEERTSDYFSSYRSSHRRTPRANGLDGARLTPRGMDQLTPPFRLYKMQPAVSEHGADDFDLGDGRISDFFTSLRLTGGWKDGEQEDSHHESMEDTINGVDIRTSPESWRGRQGAFHQNEFFSLDDDCIAEVVQSTRNSVELGTEVQEESVSFERQSSQAVAGRTPWKNVVHRSPLSPSSHYRYTE
jgi:hypothetical protein